MDNQLEERTTADTFSDYANLLWHWAWLLVLYALLAGGTAYWVSRHQTSIYQSSTLVMIDTAPSGLYDLYSSIVSSQQLLKTYAKIMTTQPVLDGVKQQLGLDELTASIQIQPIQDTQLLTVIVQDTDPDRAAMIANTLVSVFAAQLQAGQITRYADSKKILENQMAVLEQQIQATTATLNAKEDTPENQASLLTLQTNLSQYQNSYSYLLQSYSQLNLAETQSTSTIIQNDPAVPNAIPIQPQPIRNAFLAAVVGLLLAGGTIFLIEFLDDTIRDPQEITRKWGVPILGMIAHYKSNGSPLITIKQPRAPVSEAFRSLRTNLQFAGVDSPLKTILVTSPSSRDGKTTIASNLACVIAQSNRSVVLVDADLRRPQIHKYFQLLNRLGLTNQLIQPQDRSDGSIQNTELDGLKVITSSNLPSNPSELLGSVKMQEMMSYLRDQFDFIILDSTPVLMVTDAVVLAPRVDGVIIVVKPSVTKRAELHHVIEQFKQVDARVLGVVVNDFDVGRSKYYYYRWYYSSYKQKYYKGYHSPDGSSKKEKSPAPASSEKRS